MSGAVMVRSPFGGLAELPNAQGNALQTAVSSMREAQEVQAMVIMAKRFPRDEKLASQRVLTACTRPTLANQAVYQFSRGNSDVSGPSIRLAESIAQCWGNLTYGFRELEQSGGESTVEAMCWDIETNTRVTRVFKVPHVRQYVEAFGAYKDAATSLRAALCGVSTVRPVRLTGDKTVKAAPMEPVFDAGRVHLYIGPGGLDEATATAWAEDFAAFPEGPHDDAVDATALAFHALTDTGGSRMLL